MSQGSKINPDPDERGATMLESALLIGIVFIFTLSIVDIARFIMLEAILNKGAEEGLNVATKISNFDYDVRDLSVTDSRYYDFYEARRRVLEAATRLPLQTFFTRPGVPSDAELIEYEHTDREVNGAAAAPPSIVRAAAVIRPGEYVTQTDDVSRYLTNVKKPALPGELLPPRPWSMPSGLRNSPIQVELRARIRPLCPQSLCPWFAQVREIRGVALGWRENSIPRGPLPSLEPGDMPIGYGSATTVTTTTLGLAPVGEPVEEDPNVDWTEAFNRTKGKLPSPPSTWCYDSPNEIRCNAVRQ